MFVGVIIIFITDVYNLFYIKAFWSKQSIWFTSHCKGCLDRRRNNGYPTMVHMLFFLYGHDSHPTWKTWTDASFLSCAFVLNKITCWRGNLASAPAFLASSRFQTPVWSASSLESSFRIHLRFWIWMQISWRVRNCGTRTLVRAHMHSHTRTHTFTHTHTRT